MICCAPVRVAGCVIVCACVVVVVFEVAVIMASTADAKSSMHKHLSRPFK